ncbi:MAG: pyridoxamine 5'-phosphate oxidase family protein [Rhodocyclales bacterium]|nr:pyridoxamine 5'-phosphate oxidase family protein [Rhodocyclales bacterium]
MTGNATSSLTEKLIAYLRPGAPALMLTMGADGYAGSAYTWVVGIDATRLRFGVDFGSSSLENLQHSGQVSIQILGPGDLSFLAKGTARPVKERIEASAPASIMLWEMDVLAVKDQSWPGVTSTALTYEWPDKQREAMLRMEQAVYAEMRDFK